MHVGQHQAAWDHPIMSLTIWRQTELATRVPSSTVSTHCQGLPCSRGSRDASRLLFPAASCPRYEGK